MSFSSSSDCAARVEMTNLQGESLKVNSTNFKTKNGHFRSDKGKGSLGSQGSQGSVRLVCMVLGMWLHFSARSLASGCR